MIFNSVSYIIFLTIVVVLYWTLPRRPRLLLIFLSSCTFYSLWRIEFLPIMLLSTVTDYVVALQLDKSVRKRTRKAWVAVSLIINLGLLFYFKYTLFFLDNAWTGLQWLGIETPRPIFNIILPLGISFYTFQTISYTIDVYRGFIKPERDFCLYASYVTFFPQLVAGPILRAKEVLGQISERTSFDLMNIGIGSRRIIYGLFLKVMLADNIAPLVDDGFAMPIHTLSALDVWTLGFLFGFQIYFDFSAYSHIALGSAQLMGIKLMENFNFPYMSASPKDFWLRWHISLSSWIRDYLYLPLCGAKVQDTSAGGLSGAVAPKQDLKKNRALFLTWAIMGLWHGASWTFVLWGVLHASFIYGYRQTEYLRNKLPRTIRLYGGWLLTLTFIMLSWVAFRAQSLTNAFSMFAKLFCPDQYMWRGMRENTYLITTLLVLLMILLYFFKTNLAPIIKRQRFAWATVEAVAFTLIIALVIIFLRPINQFIYFQF